MTNNILQDMWNNLEKVAGNTFGKKLVKPIPESNFKDNNSSALQQFYSRELSPRQTSVKEPAFTSKKINYPDWMSNAPNEKQLNALKTIKANNPNIKMSDAEIIGKYNQYGERLLKGLSPRVETNKPMKIKPITSPSVAGINQQIQQPAQQKEQSTSTFKYQNEMNQASKQSGLSLDAFHLLRAGENQAENPMAINKNSNGTWDVGLYQINVDPNNVEEIKRLQDPLYNAMRAAEIFKSRIKLLEDPVLAIASYNLGAGGAVLRPMDAIKRAEWVYWKAGIEMPQTEFTKNPVGYVRQRMDYYKQLGLFK